MRYRKISLINPPWDDDVFRPGDWQPLNLLALASYLKEMRFTGDIQILDQAVLDSSKLLDELGRFGPDLVGLSPNYYSYQQTLKMAEVAKHSGADVVLGGNYASHLARNIIHNRSYIDYVVVLDGEEPLLSLVQGLEPHDISNLVYRKGNQVTANPVGSGTKATYCELDYSLIDLNPYFDNHLESREPNDFKRPISFMSQRGCIWKDKTGGCIFCSRELSSRFDQVQDVWRRIGRLKNKFGIDSIMDVGDDFLGNLDWFRAFHRERPAELEDIGIEFIYARVNHISPENAGILNDLNTSSVFFGIESGDQELLKNTIKGNSVRQQFKAVTRLEERGVNVWLSYVLGLPGESEKSLRTTLEHMNNMLACSNIKGVIVSLLVPLPGSPSFDLVLKRQALREKYLRSDILVLDELQRDWISNFCTVGFETVKGYMEEMNNLSAKVFPV